MKKKSLKKILFEQFWESRLNRVGFCFVVGMLIFALLAPFIANNKPYYYKHEGKTSYPILEDVYVLGQYFKHPEFMNTNFRDLKNTPGHTVVLAPVPYSPYEYNLDEILLPPSATHYMGTDDQGRDVAARMIYGSQISLSVGFVAVALYVLIGIIIGAIAGYFGGWIDIVISRLIEIVMCFPTFFLILAIIAFIEPSIYKIMIVIGITSWTGIARLVRGEFFKLRDQDFVTSARALGVSTPGIIFKHILPNALSPVLVSITFGIASSIMVESSLSFLGFGVQPPTASWGQILSQSRDYMDIAWWLMAFPGFAIFLTITAFNLVGDGMRDAIDPRTS
jgi:peptide/nickel transport system permease protein